MWLFFLMWCAISASVPVLHQNALEAFALPSSVQRLPDIFWNTSNPIFQISNTDHIVDVNKDEQYQYDQVNIVCPWYDKQLVPDEKDTERFVIYHVTKEEFDNCRISSQHPRIIAQCKTPYQPIKVTISFRSFNPMPRALEYKPGKDYYFISTSSKDDLHLRMHGMCYTNNMKLVFKVADLQQRKKSLSDGSENSKVSKPSQKVDNMDGLFEGDGAALPDGDLLPNRVDGKNATPKHGNRNKKNRMRRRKKKTRRKGDKKKKNHHPQDANNENNDIWDRNNSFEDCPPAGCNSNVIGVREKSSLEKNNKYRNNYDVSRDYDRRHESQYGAGGIPSTDENVLNDKPPSIIQHERSEVAIIKDLMRQEPSISASSSASSSKFITYTCLSNLCCCCVSFVLVILLPFASLHFPTQVTTRVLRTFII